jgi:hypothetical protein
MLPYIDRATLAQFEMDRFDSPWNLGPDIQVFSILSMTVCYGRSKRPETFAIDTSLSKFLLYGGAFGDMLMRMRHPRLMADMSSLIGFDVLDEGTRTSVT